MIKTTDSETVISMQVSINALTYRFSWEFNSIDTRLYTWKI